MTATVDIATLYAAHADGATVIDCREPYEYVAGHVPGALALPMSRFTSMLDAIPADRDLYVICQSGNRSRTVTDFLARQGRTAYSVDGGTGAWVAAGHPVVQGPTPN